MKRGARSSRRASPSPAGRTGRRAYVPRKTIYELPPLELECMKVVWQGEEISVREIREQLAADARPLAYTTVETIMDRLTRKGVVERRKRGKAHRYTPVYRKAEARAQAVAALAEHFFDGSRQALRAYLEGAPFREKPRPVGSLASKRPPASRLPHREAAVGRPRRPAPPARKPEPTLDTTLL